MSEDTHSAQKGVSKERSPNYPSIGLSTAVESARKIWTAARRASISPESAAEAIGYNSLSGPARSAIGALRQYGLLAPGQGAVALSELAVDILVHGEDTREWKEAIKVAGTTPPIFTEISSAYPGATDSIIRSYLIAKRKFSEDGAARAIKSYRETVLLVNRATEGYDRADEANDQASGEDMGTSAIAINAQDKQNQKVTAHVVPLTDGMRLEIRFVGRDVTPDDISAAEKYLKFQKELLPSN